MKLNKIMLLLAVAWPAWLRADVTPSPLFTANAVIQRETEVPVWGTAAAGEKITVTFAGQKQSAVADAVGNWEVRLSALPANVRGTLTIQGRNTVAFTNVVTGDVWLCAGQSNMGLKVSEATNASAEIAAANQPDIRQLGVPENPAQEPQPDTSIKSVWQSASPQTVGEFSAAGYFFAREIHATINVPVGIIHSSYGGTPIQSWLSLVVLEEFPGYRQALESYKDKPASPAIAAFFPARLYNGMIHPLVHFRIKGMLWYQGEGNAGNGPSGAREYADLQGRLIESWRQDWGAGDLPFYFVQLPNWNYPADATQKSWAFFREGQSAALKILNTGMAVTLDIGEPGSLHPKNKQAVGHRLALLALADTYRQPVNASGPVMADCTVKKNTIRVHFAHAEGGLISRDGLAPAGFEIAGAEGNFFPASATLERDTVVVSSPEVASPAYVRYAWADNPSVNLCNTNGLPAAPFRTDQLPR